MMKMQPIQFSNTDIIFNLHGPELLGVLVHHEQGTPIGVDEGMGAGGDREHEGINAHITVHGLDDVEQTLDLFKLTKKKKGADGVDTHAWVE
jgi:hypothetical protein